MIKAFINAKFEENVKLIIAGGTFYSNNKRTPYIQDVEGAKTKIILFLLAIFQEMK